MASDLTIKQRESLAVEQNALLIRGLNATKTGSLALAEALYNIQENELWSELGYDSLNQYVASPEISLPMATVKRYISLYISYMNYKIEDYRDISINKLELLKPILHKEKWFAHAKSLGYSDLKKEINSKIHGKEPVDNEIEEHIKNHSKCSYWDGCKCMKEVKDLI